MAETKPLPTPGKVAAIKIPCKGERGGISVKCGELPANAFIPVEIDENDPIFRQAGFTAPVSKKIGLPLRMRKCWSSDDQGLYRNGVDDVNQVATYLVIETDSGIAKWTWQDDVGTVIVAREDKKPLSREHLEVFWSYNKYLIYRYGYGDFSSVDNSITLVNFEKYFKYYNCKRPKATDFVEEWNKA